MGRQISKALNGLPELTRSVAEGPGASRGFQLILITSKSNIAWRLRLRQMPPSLIRQPCPRGFATLHCDVNFPGRCCWDFHANALIVVNERVPIRAPPRTIGNSHVD